VKRRKLEIMKKMEALKEIFMGEQQAKIIYLKKFISSSASGIYLLHSSSARERKRENTHENDDFFSVKLADWIDMPALHIRNTLRNMNFGSFSLSLYPASTEQQRVIFEASAK
jgi:hypothetical protein